MKKSTLFKQLALGVGFSAVLVMPAIAAPIATFDYTQEFEFVEPITPVGDINKSGATVGIDNIVGGVTKLDWGVPFNNDNKVSSLVINPDGTDSETPSNALTQGTVTVASDINSVVLAAGPSIVHNNFVIRTDSPSLEHATAQDNVILTPTGFGALPAQQITFGIDFFETPNLPENEAACVTDKFTPGVGCGDIFSLTGGLLGVPTMLNNGTVLAFLIDSFVLDGYIYDTYITSNGLGVLTDRACSAIGAASGCIGFTTFENLSNQFDLEFGIVASEAPMPEPATLALLAGGLLLMGLSRRKKAGNLSA